MFQSQFAFFLGFSIHEHVITETWHRLQVFLLTSQEILQFGQKFLALGHVAELEDEVMVLEDSY